MDSADVERIFRRLDRELWIVTASDGHEDGGLVATFVAVASIVPECPRVLVGLSRLHRTWELVDRSAAFALHQVANDQLERVWTFGLCSARNVDKFAEFAVHRGRSGSPLLPDAPAWLDCRVEARLETGDRTLFLAEVLDGRINRDVPLLTMHRLLDEAPPEKRAELRRQLVEDATRDAAAIRDWRRERNPHA